ncbi:hypothetical protein [Deinococcus sp. UYEF24]
MLTPAALFLGAAALLAVLKSPPRPLPARVSAPVRLTPSNTRPTWNPAAPLGERGESVVVLPYHPALRTVKLVEVFGLRRELLYSEVTE